MAVHLMPRFIADLKSVNDAGFARRVLRRTLSDQGTWTQHNEDHRYRGIENAWIRYVSTGSPAYRVIYIQSGGDIFLYRAGPHSVEDRLPAPRARDYADAVAVDANGNEVEAVRRMIDSADSTVAAPTRFVGSRPNGDIHRSLVGRRNLPHKEIWLVSPVVDPAVLSPTASLGSVLAAQVEDGASVSIVTSLPHDRDIAWMEDLEARDMGVFVHPRLHTKLYCFVFDENRRFDPGVPEDATAASLIMVGSVDITEQILAPEEIDDVIEDLCYLPPEGELDFVMNYLTELIDEGFDLADVRRRLTGGREHTLTGARS